MQLSYTAERPLGSKWLLCFVEESEAQPMFMAKCPSASVEPGFHPHVSTEGKQRRNENECS